MLNIATWRVMPPHAVTEMNFEFVGLYINIALDLLVIHILFLHLQLSHTPTRSYKHIELLPFVFAIIPVVQKLEYDVKFLDVYASFLYKASHCA